MISYLANPQRFLNFARYAEPVFMGLTIILLGLGIWQGLFVAPPDVKHGEAVRILFVHVPAAMLCMGVYVALFVASAVSFIWRHNLADYGAQAFARIGLVFTALCLITGSIWGKTGWGTWWEWDGRMTSVLVLFFIYVAYLFLWVVIEERKLAARLAAIFAMVGMVNIPIIKYSVDWWNSLHQTATVSSLDAPGMASAYDLPLALMVGAYVCLTAWLSIKMVKTDIERQRRKRPAETKGATIQIEDI